MIHELPQDFILSPVRTTTGGQPGILPGRPVLLVSVAGTGPLFWRIL